jgi:hypothetical protein
MLKTIPTTTIKYLTYRIIVKEKGQKIWVHSVY